MRLAFLPGELYLDTTEDGHFRITKANQEILRTRSQRAAVRRFNELRQEMENRFPAHETSKEEKAQIFRRMIGDALVQHNSLGGRKKKTTAGSTRTFGG
ncbi:MAG: hypothetical protein ACRD18_14100 [Terriglobia bacterium]